MRLDLQTRDAFDAAIFYAEAFDWARPPGGCTVDYAQDHIIVQAAGRTVATLYGGGDETGPDPQVRPQWNVHLVHPRLSACVQSGGSDGRGRPGSGSGLGTPGSSGRGGSGGGVGDPGGAGGSGGTGGSTGFGRSTGSTRSGGPGGDGGSGGGTDVMSGSGGTGTVPMITASYWCSSSLLIHLRTTMDVVLGAGEPPRSGKPCSRAGRSRRR